MARQGCRVSFKDSDGVLHEAEVQAESLYEAAVLALKAFKVAWTDGPKPATRLSIQVMSPVVRHEVTVAQVKAWLERNSNNPNDQARKRDLKALLK